jgi:hypothetical protein
VPIAIFAKSAHTEAVLHVVVVELKAHVEAIDQQLAGILSAVARLAKSVHNEAVLHVVAVESNAHVAPSNQHVL